MLPAVWLTTAVINGNSASIYMVSWSCDITCNRRLFSADKDTKIQTVNDNRRSELLKDEILIYYAQYNDNVLNVNVIIYH